MATDTSGTLSRRTMLQAAAAVGAASFLPVGWAAQRVWPPENVPLTGTFDNVRYDDERQALVLAGDTGSYPRTGMYTSPPIRCGRESPIRISWKPRWTTPLAWERFTANPILEPGQGSWDDTAVSTCSVIPSGETLNIFYGARDRGIGLAVASAQDPRRWTRRAGPLLQAGDPGTFDAGGVLSPAVLPVSDSHWFMYYVGYDPTRIRGSIKVHQIGLAESRDAGASWSRVTREPVIALGPEGSCDGATISSNSVLRVGSRWYSWYTGMSQIPYLASICLATSADGIHWEKYPHNPVLAYNPYVEAEAFIVATPHVLYEEGVFKMWYNAKGFGEGRAVGDYRICYAESLDGIRWERCPLGPVLNPGPPGSWDSQMVEYPEVLNLRGQYHMWYCGDGYGNIGHASGRPLTRAIVQTRTGPAARPDANWTPWTDSKDPAGTDIRAREYVQVRVVLETDERRISPMIQQLALH